MVVHFTIRTHEVQTKNFDLLKAFGYIERVVKSDFFFRVFFYHACATCSDLPSYISPMVLIDKDTITSIKTVQLKKVKVLVKKLKYIQIFFKKQRKQVKCNFHIIYNVYFPRNKVCPR